MFRYQQQYWKPAIDHANAGLGTSLRPSTNLFGMLQFVAWQRSWRRAGCVVNFESGVLGSGPARAKQAFLPCEIEELGPELSGKDETPTCLLAGYNKSLNMPNIHSHSHSIQFNSAIPDQGWNAWRIPQWDWLTPSLIILSLSFISHINIFDLLCPRDAMVTVACEFSILL